MNQLENLKQMKTVPAAEVNKAGIDVTHLFAS